MRTYIYSGMRTVDKYMRKTLCSHVSFFLAAGRLASCYHMSSSYLLAPIDVLLLSHVTGSSCYCSYILSHASGDEMARPEACVGLV